MCWKAGGRGFAGIWLAAPPFPNLPIYFTLGLDSKIGCQGWRKLRKSLTHHHQSNRNQTPRSLFRLSIAPFDNFSPFLICSLPVLLSLFLFSGFSCFELDENGIFQAWGRVAQDCRDLYIKKHKSPSVKAHLSLQFKYSSPLYTCHFMIYNSTTVKN